MQATKFSHDFQPRSQPQVKGIAEDDLSVDLLEFQRRHCLDRAVGADWHEDRRLDHTVVQFDAAATGFAVGIKQGKFKHDGHG